LTVEDFANEEPNSNGSRCSTSPSRQRPLRIQAYTISDIYAAVSASAAEHAWNLYRSSSCGATVTNRGRSDLQICLLQFMARVIQQKSQGYYLVAKAHLRPEEWRKTPGVTTIFSIGRRALCCSSVKDGLKIHILELCCSTKDILQFIVSLMAVSVKSIELSHFLEENSPRG
jgi:hypothetical protein